MPASADHTGDAAFRRRRGARAIWLAIGLLLTGIGIIGVVVPLLPTVDFLVLALFCFARSSPRLEAWLLNHPRFGPPLRAWRQERAIPRHAKLAAWTGMGIGYGLFLVFARPGLLLGVIVAMAIAASALWIARRPEPNAPE